MRARAGHLRVRQIGDRRLGQLIEDYLHIVIAAVDHRDIHLAIAVEVAGNDRKRTTANGNVGALGRKAAVAIGEQNRDAVRAVVRGRNVIQAIAVEVSDGNAYRVRSGRGSDRSGCEAAIAVAQQYGDVVPALAPDGKVGDAVPVEVADPDRLLKRAVAAGKRIVLVGKRAVAIAQSHLKIRIGDKRKILMTVAVEVACNNEWSNVRSGGELDIASGECAIPIAKKNKDLGSNSSELARGRENIWDAVSIEVGYCEGRSVECEESRKRCRSRLEGAIAHAQ